MSKVPIYHTTCRGTAFHYDHAPSPGEIFPLEQYAVEVDAVDWEQVICQSCGLPAHNVHLRTVNDD